MRLPRSTPCLLALSLLTSAATASAECAWVVWQQFVTTTPPAGGIASWVAEKSFTSAAPCEALAVQLNEKMEWRRSETSNNVSAAIYLGVEQRRLALGLTIPPSVLGRADQIIE